MYDFSRLFNFFNLPHCPTLMLVLVCFDGCFILGYIFLSVFLCFDLYCFLIYQLCRCVNRCLAILGLLQFYWVAVMLQFGFLPLVWILLVWLFSEIYEWVSFRKSTLDWFLWIPLLLLLLRVSLKQFDLFFVRTVDSTEEFCINGKRNFMSFLKLTDYFGNILARLEIIQLVESTFIWRIPTMILKSIIANLSEFEDCRSDRLISPMHINFKNNLISLPMSEMIKPQR